MRKRSFIYLLSTMLPLVALLVLPAERVTAGCGCDHPPPAWALVMPPFASATHPVTIFAEGADFLEGEVYAVKFGKQSADVIADSPNSLRVDLPHGVTPGPTEIHVKGPGYDHKYPREIFTALPKPIKLPPYSGAFKARKLRIAVAADGTVLVPVDLSRVREPTQFALRFPDLPLDFESDDVVLHNSDGVDLTIFTLSVDDSTVRQWGSYYGWKVEDDTGLEGVVYDTKVKKTKDKNVDSDVFTYWRHEFHTYEVAHETGGTHEVDAEGYHPDGTLHIDHDHLVIAIAGFTRPKDYAVHFTKLDVDLEAALAKAEARYADSLEKEAGDPEKIQKAEEEYVKDLDKAERRYAEKRLKLVAKAARLKGGHEDLDVVLLAIQSENPIEPGAVVDTAGTLPEEEF